MAGIATSTSNRECIQHDRSRLDTQAPALDTETTGYKASIVIRARYNHRRRKMVGSFFNPVADTWHYETDKHIPDLSHKVIIVTGANAGLGLASVIELAKHHPRRLYLTARTKAKYDTARAAVIAAAPNANVEFLEMDLSSFASIKLAAESFLADNDRLDILMNNAGIMGQPSAATQEGYEIHFGTNHMGHALFIKLLLPLLVEIAEQPGSDVRIVNVSSEAHMFAAGNGFVPEEVKGAGKSHPFRHYGYSKMANILYTRGLATRYPAILSTSPHPGMFLPLTLCLPRFSSAPGRVTW